MMEREVIEEIVDDNIITEEAPIMELGEDGIIVDGKGEDEDANS